VVRSTTAGRSSAHCGRVARVINLPTKSHACDVTCLSTYLASVAQAEGGSRGWLRWYKREMRKQAGRMLAIGDGANDVAMIQASSFFPWEWCQVFSSLWCWPLATRGGWCTPSLHSSTLLCLIKWQTCLWASWAWPSTVQTMQSRTPVTCFSCSPTQLCLIRRRTWASASWARRAGRR